MLRLTYLGARMSWMAALLALLMSLPGMSRAATGYAPIMPLARHSLLLDISSAGNRAVTVGARGHILYSDDRGGSWRQASVPTTQMLTGVYFLNGQRGWTVGHDGLILVSDDGGVNWRIQRDGLAAQQQANLELQEQAHQQIQALESALGIASQQSRPALEMRLADAEMDLEDADLALAEDVFTSPLMDVWFQDAALGWAVGAFGTLLATDDGGQSWINQAGGIENPDEFHLNAVTGDSQGRVFIAGEGGVMYRSLDAGRSWEALDAFYQGSWFGTVYSAPHRALLVFGLRGNAYRSEDFGDSWQAVDGAGEISLAGGAAGAHGEIVLVGSAGTVLRSADGGQSFQNSVLPDRLSLSSALYSGKQLILTGQGGVKLYYNNDADD